MEGIERKREDGWYWVRYAGEWLPAEYHFRPYSSGECWTMRDGYGDTYADKHLQDIGPRIEKPEGLN